MEKEDFKIMDIEAFPSTVDSLIRPTKKRGAKQKCFVKSNKNK